jgi:hypothetical protein
MEFIEKYLGPSKVTLDINTNHFEEVYDYPDEKYEIFNNIESIIDMFKELSTNKQHTGQAGQVRQSQPQSSRQSGQSQLASPHPQPHPQQPPPPPPPPRQQKQNVDHQVVDDKFIYCVLLSLDDTLSLVSDKNMFINKFKTDLIEKINNYEKQLKKLSIIKSDIIEAFKDKNDRDALYKYVSVVINKSIAIHKSDTITLFENTKSGTDCLYINENTLSYENITLNEAKNRYNLNRKLHYTNTITSEKLNDYIVKDLKTIAEELGLETTKIEDNKKKNLLKAELKEIIKTKLFPLI